MKVGLTLLNWQSPSPLLPTGRKEGGQRGILEETYVRPNDYF
jgi:hypothetical protein